ncbi:hypothetical protein GGR56DRAFT_688231 [Xylariaceae sp. FL0804]|nr:hypothetical protein GGR56DRAFT_688231 [Xylariaceae sp. FL0804]
MPRPKRAGARAAALRRANATKTPAATAPAPAPAHAPASRPERADTSSDIYDVSDREKEKAKERRKLRETRPASTRKPAAANPRRGRDLEVARQRGKRDSALDRLGDMTSTENMTSTANTGAVESTNRSDESIELGRRTSSPPLYGRLADLSGLDLDDTMFGDLNTTFDTAGPASAHRSADTSTLSATHFKRRPRAGSFLSRDDGPIRPSSRAGPNTPGVSSTFNIGVFKRRAREPSILGTAQKPRPQLPDPGHGSEQENEDESDEDLADEDQIAQEDVSTALKRSKKSLGELEAGHAASSVNTRKRKSTEGHEQRVRSSPYAVDDPIVASVEQEDSVLPSSPPSRPRQRESSDPPSTPFMDHELMAPPLSSGSSEGGEEAIWPPLKSLAKGRGARRPVSRGLRRTPVPISSGDNASDMSSPPSLTYSPNYADEPSPPPPPPPPARRAAARSSRRRAPSITSKPAPKVTTADLASMLPRRRRRAARGEHDDDEEDDEVDISGLPDGDDELSHLDVRARRRRPARSATRGAAAASSSAAAAAGGKGKQTTRPAAAARKATRTYGRASDKENQPEDDNEDEDEEAGEEEGDSLGPIEQEQEEDSQAMVERMGTELKDAARKFQEVDKWQLDYEEMTQSSSPRDAR